MFFALDKVGFAYDNGQPILEDLSLVIERGQAVALVGANGSGKTTVLNLLAGIHKASSGQVLFKDQALSADCFKNQAYMKAFHKDVGIVFQRADSQLFCPSVYEEIAFGPRQMGLSQDQVDQRVHDMVALLGLEDLLEAVPYQLSGGQKKRVTLAATLALNPEVLLLDEPMAALDPRTQKVVLNLLSMLRQAGKTLVIATHDLHRLPDMVDRVILFDEKHRIVADDRPQVVLQEVDLLKAVNLVDEDYHVHIHRHGDGDELHIHL